ncbi:SusC/RagA family TonB-linked outer membrane protein [Mucilaginibacter lappiensis]|uniref:Iron complex outermembrane receptor protein n=1 Tax=Mucilaginibacter lappiensis TaxID=354630 RepID=A0A841JIY8_9SPHI|nr:SusC/RagA family TonB-linked outer membrane protein [Mucilaginibacter lappiensis]MBB6128658.1 iron complex outermembrane receptor protein [Mucilaginibacter lappiensis]
MQLKNLLKVSCLAIFCFFAVPALAQNRVITGKVTDSHDGSPMPGVSIVAKGSTIGTNTGPNGDFKLSLPASNNTLVVSFIGYVKQEVDITGKTTINIALVGSATALSEVQIVSVGYGSSRKKDLTGAVSNIGAKDFNQGAIINPLQQVQGKVAGLVITQGGGDPNQNATVRLRGQTSLTGSQSPLFVVDGIQLDDPTQFQNIPPGDIASYDVLKDASATAIYGARGANGVIIVNTKRGSAGKTQVDYNGYASLAKQSKYYDLLTASEFRALPSFQQSLEAGGNTDWQKAVTRTAYTHSNNVAISGGAGSFNYRASLNFQNQEGVVINSGKKQLGIRFSAEQKAFNDKLDIQFGISNVNTTRKLTDYNSISYVFNAPPTFPVYNADGTYYTFTGFNLANPVEHLNQILNTNNEYLTLINATINYTLAPGLKVGVFGTTSRNNVQTHYFVPQFPDEGNVSTATDNNYNTNSYKGDVHINYDKNFGKHTISAALVGEYNDYLYSTFSANGQQFLVPANLDNNLGSGNPSFNAIGSNKSEYKIRSNLARVNYNYDGTYYITASVRRDESNKFGANHQVGYFPSFDLAYRFKRDLLGDVDWINDLKLRAGYGVVGNSEAIGPYSTLGLVNSQTPGSTTITRFYDPVTKSYLSAYSPIQNPNPDLRWEERHGRNIGLDFSLFNDRLSGDINYYNDITKNLLYNYSVPTPPFVYNSILANVGSLTNKGLEIAITGKILTGDGLNWTANGNIAFNKTRIKSLSGTYNGNVISTDEIPVGYAQGRGLSADPITYLRPGYAPNLFYLPHFTGNDANGNQTFDGQTIAQNGSPKRYYIDPSPKFNYGLSNSFNYKNWSLNFFIRGVYGQKLFNNSLLNVETVTRLPSNNTTKEALTNGTKDGPVSSDRWLQGASFLRLDNASLGYDFKNVKGFSTLRVYVAANNLFVITKYKGLDPEVTVAESNQAYIDANYGGYGYYPKTRTFTLGTNISFK